MFLDEEILFEYSLEKVTHTSGFNLAYYVYYRIIINFEGAKFLLFDSSKLVY